LQRAPEIKDLLSFKTLKTQRKPGEKIIEKKFDGPTDEANDEK